MIENFSNLDAGIIDSIFLDLDGTVSESGESCKNGVKYMFGKIGLDQPSEEELNAFVGPTVKVHLVAEHGFSEDEAAHAYVFYREYYDGIGIFESTMYEGVDKAIINMKESGRKVYLATLKPEEQAVQITKRYKIDKLFDGIYGARHDLGILHKPQVLQRAVEKIGRHPGESVMVGDRKYDIIAAKQMGFYSVGVLYGYGTRQELTEQGCDIVVQSVADLAGLFSK